MSFFFASPQAIYPYRSDLCKKTRSRISHAWAPLNSHRVFFGLILLFHHTIFSLHSHTPFLTFSHTFTRSNLHFPLTLFFSSFSPFFPAFLSTLFLKFFTLCTPLSLFLLRPSHPIFQSTLTL